MARVENGETPANANEVATNFLLENNPADLYIM
jgi:hypothetical protein